MSSVFSKRDEIPMLDAAVLLEASTFSLDTGDVPKRTSPAFLLSEATAGIVNLHSTGAASKADVSAS